jgi:hypothetical protein
MITEVFAFGTGGLEAYKTFTPLSASGLHVNKLSAGPLTSSRPQFPAPMQDGKPVYGRTPVPDVGMGGDKQYCTIHSLCRANNVDTGFALDAIRNGTISADAKHYGNSCWEAGASANKASSKLAIAHAAHLAVSEVKQNRKPASRPN